MSIISKETLVEKMKQYPTLLQQVMVMLDALGECLTTVSQCESDSTDAKTSSSEALKKVNDITYDIKELMSNNKNNVATSNFSLDLSQANNDNAIYLGNIADNIEKINFVSKVNGVEEELSFASIYTKYVEDTDLDSIIYKPENFDNGDIIFITCSEAPTTTTPISITLTPSTTNSEITLNGNFAILIKVGSNNFLVLFAVSNRSYIINYYTSYGTSVSIKTLEDNIYFTPVIISAYDNNY